jgi:hypothetical protein
MTNHELHVWYSLWSGIHSEFGKVIEKSYTFWEDEVPLSTLVMGDLGQCVLTKSDSFSDDDMRRIFSLVEKEITSTDEEKGTAIATGFVEAMASFGDYHPVELERALTFIGKESMAYLEAWNDFCFKRK